MKVVVNGEPTELSGAVSIRGLVSTLVSSPSGIAVAVNGEVVPRSAWTRRTLAEGDHVEVLTAVRGG